MYRLGKIKIRGFIQINKSKIIRPLSNDSKIKYGNRDLTFIINVNIVKKYKQYNGEEGMNRHFMGRTNLGTLRYKENTLSNSPKQAQG